MCTVKFLSQWVYFSNNWKSRETIPMYLVSTCQYISMYWPKFYKCQEFEHNAGSYWMRIFHQLIVTKFLAKTDQWSLRFEIWIGLSLLDKVAASC